MVRASASSACAGRAAKSAQRVRRRRGIDFSEIPKVSPVQLRAMRRVGRPPLGAEPRRLIAIRIDPRVLDAMRREAKRRRLGYQSLINDLHPTRVGRRHRSRRRWPRVSRPLCLDEPGHSTDQTRFSSVSRRGGRRGQPRGWVCHARSASHEADKPSTVAATTTPVAPLHALARSSVPPLAGSA
jgi:uncharacterized protein (DUF4415 family)